MANYISQVTLPSGTSYDVRELFPHVGNCTDAAATAAKTVTIGNFKLYTGAWVVVKFSNTNSAAVASLTLNVDGTGAKPIKYRNANLGSAGSLIANRYTYFIYDGTNYQIVGDLDTNSDTYNRTRTDARIYAGTVGVFNYSLCAVDNNQRIQSFTTTAGTGTSKAFNTSAHFLCPPVIFYHHKDGTVANGSAVENGTLYEQYPSTDIRYSCNKTSSAGFTAYKPLYVECDINDDGTWSITSNGLTQTFIAGKYYIFLGSMYNTSIYQLALTANHSMMYYDGTNLKIVEFTAAEKTKLAGIATGATKVESSTNGKIKINGTDTTVYTHPTYTSKTSGLYKITVDSTGHVSGTSSVTATDIPPLDYLPLTGGTLTGDLTLKTDGTGDSPSLIFQRGTLTDEPLEWRIYDSGGRLHFDRNAANTGAWKNIFNIDPSNNRIYFNGNDGVAKYVSFTDTKNTAGSTDTSSKIYLIGATSQAANPQTYSDNEVYTTSGVLTTKKVQVGGGSCTMEYNSTTETLDFVFT